MGSIILNDAEISEETIVAAGSLVPERKNYPPRVLLMGSPARIIRELAEDDLLVIRGTPALSGKSLGIHQRS